MTTKYGYVEVNPCLARGHFLGWHHHPSPPWIQQIKHNGERRTGQMDDGIAYFTGRRKSSVTGELLEKGDNLPHLRGCPKELNGAILDGEVYIPGGTSSDMTKIMALKSAKDAERLVYSMPEKPRYGVFDLIALPGRRFVTQLPLAARLELLVSMKDILAAWSPSVHIVSTTEVSEDRYNTLINLKEEGVVLKDARSRYVYGVCGSWVKVVPEHTATVIMTGMYQGEGKYAHTLGAIRFAGVVEGKQIWGACAGMSDAERDEIKNNLKKYLGRPFDVKYKRVTGSALISAQFDRWRDDL